MFSNETVTNSSLIQSQPDAVLEIRIEQIRKAVPPLKVTTSSEEGVLQFECEVSAQAHVEHWSPDGSDILGGGGNFRRQGQAGGNESVGGSLWDLFLSLTLSLSPLCFLFIMM
jgi:hypothetical protein